MVLTFVEVMTGVTTDVVVGERAISSRSVIGRRDTYCGATDVHTLRRIDPDDPLNIPSLLAFE